MDSLVSSSDFQLFQPLCQAFRIVPSAPITIGITVIFMYFTPCLFFPHQCQLVVFHWNLSNSKFLYDSRTLQSILADHNNVIVWIVSLHPPISKFSNRHSNPFVSVPSLSITSGIIVTFIFHSFLSSLAKSKYVSLFIFFKFSCACRSCQLCKKKGSSKVCGWICSIWHSCVWESQHASTGDSVSWSQGHSSRSSFHLMEFFPSLKQNYFAYRSSKVSDCIFKIHQLWQSGCSRVYSNCCCSCSFEPEIIKIDQSSYKMYSMVNFQESTTILNACPKVSGNLLKVCEGWWKVWEE